MNTCKQPACALLQARVGWNKDGFEVSAYGRNVLEKHCYANVLDLGPAGFVGAPGDPAPFRVEWSAKL